MIEVKNVRKVYKSKNEREQIALDDVSFLFPNKGFVSIIGSSGSGKSTLLNMIGLLDTPTEGSIYFNNEDISKFDEKKKTSYRNSEIGFIFQEFNLFNELSVYDNVSLALDLKNKEDKEKVMEVLKLVKLDKMASKKINELSGGEKQRVGVARAIVKKPSVVLADEPTGNLDSNNSKIVFDILKEISKECLVVVVTHDKDNAKNYADLLILLEDGKIKNEIKNIDTEISFEKFKKIKSRISFKKSIKFAWGMLNKKKGRLIFTILIISVATLLLGLSLNTIKFDINSIHADVMFNNNEKVITITKKSDLTMASLGSKLFLDDYHKLVKIINEDIIKYSQIYAGSDINFLVFGGFYEDFNEKYYNNAYYKTIDGVDKTLSILTLNEDELTNLDIIGNIPKNEYEVLIPEILADYLVVHGFDKRLDKGLIEEIHVKTKEELLNNYLYINYVDKVKIVGIIKDKNLSKYEELKKENYDKMTQEPSKLYKEFKEKYFDIVDSKICRFVVGDNFWNSSFLENNTFANDVFANSFIFKDMNVYNIYNIKFSDKVNDGEIILSYEMVDKMYRSEITKDYDIAINKAYKKYKEDIKKRDELISKYESICLETGNCDYVVPEVPMVDVDKIREDVYKNIIIEKGLLGNNIIFKVDNTKYELKVKDIDYSVYINKNQFKDYILGNEIIYKMETYVNDKAKVEKIFNDFESINDYKVTTKFSDSINNISNFINSFEKIIVYIVVGLMLFVIILFSLFISNNVIYNKNKVGILRAIGASVFDVVKIFALEGIIISIFVFIISNLLTIGAIYFINSFIGNELGFYINLINYNPNTMLIILLLEILVIMISLIIPMIHLSKTKPIKLLSK